MCSKCHFCAGRILLKGDNITLMMNTWVVIFPLPLTKSYEVISTKIFFIYFTGVNDVFWWILFCHQMRCFGCTKGCRHSPISYMFTSFRFSNTWGRNTNYFAITTLYLKDMLLLYSSFLPPALPVGIYVHYPQQIMKNIVTSWSLDCSYPFMIVFPFWPRFLFLLSKKTNVKS